MNGQMTLPILPQSTANNGMGLDPMAVQLFNRTYRNPQTNGLRRLVGRQSQPLQVLHDIEAEQGIRNRHYVGLKSIPLANIRGTLNRADDFDAKFRPLKVTDKDRWSRVASMMMDGRDLGPIDVIQVGEDYYVKDGHHRVSVANAMDYGYLDAIVERWGEG